MSLREIYTQVILDHYKRPRNKGVLEEATHSARCDNPLCGDKVHLYLKVENKKITGASFEGNGCAISQASASIMTQMIKGKSIAEARDLRENFRKLLLEKDWKPDPRILGDLIALEGVKKLHARVKCAICAWHALEAALEGKDAVDMEKVELSANNKKESLQPVELEEWEKGI